jgi:HSP20 family protein
MAIKDLVKMNGETSNLPVRREDEYGYGYPALHREMTQWMEQWDRWFDSFFNRGFGLTPWTGQPSSLGNQWKGWWPAVNVSESEKEYQLTAELPGLDENDIELTLGNDSITLKGEKKNEYEDKGSSYYRMERSFGSFHRTIPLPEGVDIEHVDANFKQGVLTVTLPKLPAEQTGAKKVQIKSEGK